ncbi:hypothetical protein ASPU41_19465 [Arthrobacter sp. U41]|nr:hypothetical protein ASPU41_19465 [Arthrobacter sp. U41]
MLSCHGERIAGLAGVRKLVSGGAAGAGCAAFEGAALVLAHAAPDAGVLPGLEGPLEAGVDDWASTANTLGFLDLQKGRTGVSYGEE